MDPNLNRTALEQVRASTSAAAMAPMEMPGTSPGMTEEPVEYTYKVTGVEAIMGSCQRPLV